MNILQTIVLKIAKGLGLNLSTKDTNDDAYSNIYDISLTAAIANRVSTLTLMDTSVSIKGNSIRSAYIDKLYKEVIVDKIDTACEVALGTGDCLIKPYSDGSRIGVDVIKNGDFYICESIGNFIKACIIRCETIKKNSGEVFERFEVQRIKDYEDEAGINHSALFINTYAFRNSNNVDLASVPEWKNIEPEVVILNTDKLLLGRIKCPTVNRNAVNSPNGVPITFGLDSVIKTSVDSFKRFNDEYSKKEPFIFADKTLFKRDKETGRPAIPNGKDRLFMSIPSAYGDSDKGVENLIKEYSPEIRSEALTTGIEQNFKMLEMLAGLSPGVLSSPTTNYATATELKASLQLTFAFITKFRRSIEQGINDLIDSISILLDLNGEIPDGSVNVSIDWSSSYIENLTEQFNRLCTAHSINAVTTAEVRAWLLDEDLETAEAVVKAINEEKS